MERRQRPQLPGSTPTTLTSNKTPYASASAIIRGPLMTSKSMSLKHEEEDSMMHGNHKGMMVEHAASTTSNHYGSESGLTSKTTVKSKLLRKMISSLPFELRESVGSAVEFALQQSEQSRAEVDHYHVELLALRGELKKKMQEIEQLNLTYDMMKKKNEALELTIGEMQDQIDTRQHNLVKNRQCINRMAGANRMLIDSLDALEMRYSKAHGGGPIIPPENSDNGSTATPETGGGMNDKLRESLLRTSREHYRHMKQIEVLEASVDSLKQALKKSEASNRRLKLSLEEFQQSQEEEEGLLPPPPSTTTNPSSTAAAASSVSTHLPHASIPAPGTARSATGAMTATAAAPTTHTPIKTAGANENKSKSADRLFGHLDELFQDLIRRQHLDVTDGLVQLRRLNSYVSSAPNTHVTTEVLAHLNSREVMKIFEAEMVIVYLIPLYNNQVFHKYTVKSAEPEIMNFKGCMSYATDCILKGQACRHNTLNRAHCLFNGDVDGHPSVAVKRIMSVPLYDSSQGKVIGAVQFLNKTNGDVFTDADEVFAQMFAEHAVVWISSCQTFERISVRSRTLASLLDVSTDIYDVLPENTDAALDLLPGELLSTIERLARQTLQLTTCKAFLVSSALGMAPGQLIVLNRQSMRGRRQSAKFSAREIMNVKDNVGCVGACLKSKNWLTLEGEELEITIHASVDLDPMGLPMITAPVLNAANTVIACIQMIPGPNSPKFEAILEAGIDNVTISFEQALQWFLHQLSHPLEFLLKYVGKTVPRPFTPGSFRITRSNSMFSPGGKPTSPGTPQLLSITRPTMSPIPDIASRKSVASRPSSSRYSISLNNLSDALADISSIDNQSISGDVKSILMRVKAKLDAVQREIRDASMRPASRNESTTQVLSLDGVRDSSRDTATPMIAENEDEILPRPLSRAPSRGSQINEEELRNSIRQELTRQMESEFQARLEKMREETKAKVLASQQKSSKLESALSSKENMITTQASKIFDLENEVALLMEALNSERASRDAVEANAADSDRAKEELSAQNALLEERVTSLEQAMVEKESILSILQAQLVKMAESNLVDLNRAARRATDSAASQDRPEDYLIPGTPPTKPATPATSIGAASLKGPPTNLSGSSTKSKSRPPSIGRAPGTPGTPLRAVSEAGDVLQSDPNEDSNLPEHWSVCYDDQGQKYYYNDSTGESSWFSPVSDGQRNAGGAIVGDWMEQFDTSGQSYWTNMVTGQSEWTLPADAASGGSATAANPAKSFNSSYKIEL